MMARTRSLICTAASTATLALVGSAFGQNACLDAGVDAACCDTVCSFNPLCCDVSWDQECIDLQASLCGGGGGGTCPVGEIADCNGNCCPEGWVGDGYCDDGTYTWNGIAIFLNCDQFANDGGDCDGGGGSALCGDPAAGDCCVANGTPACADQVCCETVCAADAFCCDTEWDQICADQAATACPACVVSCTLPSNSITEAELCGDDTNGGCNAAGETESIALGDSVRGTFWATGGTRDTDWYTLTVAEGTEVSLAISSSAPCFAAMVDLACGGIIGSSATVGTCPGTSFQCVPAGTYYVVALPSGFDGMACGTGEVNDYVLQVSGVACDATPPANDTCANASVAIEGYNAFDTTFALTDVGVVSCGFGGAPFLNDVFFTFTATQDGNYQLETCSGSAPFDTGIEVYDMCPELGGALLACNDDGGGCLNYSSSVFVPMTTGQTVTILVGGWNGATGATELNILFAGDQACPTGEIQDCNGNCCPETWVGDGFCDDGTYAWNGIAIFLNCDQFANDGGDCDGGGGGACGDPAAGDCCIANGTPACADLDCCSAVCAADAFCCDTEWDQLCADAAVASCAVCGGSGGDPPANDNCADAQSVGLGDHAFDTNGATTDGANPTDASCGAFGANFYNDVWFSFTAPAAGDFTASTCNQATFDTRIDILDACGGNLIACNDDGDGCAGFSSLVTFTATSGQNVLIRVGAYGAAGFGTGTLSITDGGGGGGSAGTSCADPVVITAGDTAFSNAGMTEEVDLTGYCDPGPFGTDIVYNAQWFAFSPTQSGSYDVSTCNQATFDSKIAVLTSCDATSVVACNDDGDGCAGYSSFLTFEASCDTTYFIVLGGYSATTAQGTGTLSVSTANGVDCGGGGGGVDGDLDGDGHVNGADLAICLGGWGGPGGDVDGDGTTNGADLAMLLGNWGV